MKVCWLLALTAAVLLLLQCWESAAISLADRFPKKNYTATDVSPEDKFCIDLADACPYLRSPTAKPTPSQLSPVKVNITFFATNFVGIDDLAQQLSVQGNFYLKWELPPCADWTNREQQTYTATDIKLCSFNKSQIWTPLLAHTNAMGNYDVFEKAKGDVVVKNDGIALWQVSGRFDSSCNLAFKKFPFDVQVCYLEVGFLFPSFITFESKLNIDPSFISFSDIWSLDNNFTVKINDQLTEKVQFTFRLARIASAYLNSIFLPIALLALAQMCTIAIPAEDSGRSAFSITVFLSFSITQSSFDSDIPNTSEVMYLNIYIAANMGIAILITLYSLIMCRFVNKMESVFQKRVGRTKLTLIDILDASMFLFTLTLFFLVSLLFYIPVIYRTTY